MSKCDAMEFKHCVLDLKDALRKNELDLNDVNMKLDHLNALDVKINVFEEEKIENLIISCCTAVPTSNTLLVAKSCNMILNHVLKNKITLSNDNLRTILHWTNEAFQKSSDLAFLDILQIINALIKTHQSFFSEHCNNLLSFLFEKLEDRTNVLQPNDVKVWRVYCLQSLAKTIMKEERIVVVTELLNILYSQPADNLFVHSKIWRTVIETLDCLVPKGNTKWLTSKLADIIGVIEVAATLGLNGKEPVLPKLVYPSAVFTPEPSTLEAPSKNSAQNQPGKKKQKSKRVSWIEKKDEDLDIKDAPASDVYQLSNFTSDSDYSDSESSQAGKLAKEQAKTRHAAFNFIIRLSNILKGKQLYGYYNVLIISLIQCLRNETAHKTRIAALAAVGALLLHSKPFLAQAQHSEGTSFLAFSASLSELVSGLHTSLGGCLSSVPPVYVLTPLLHTTASLISVSPYHRLRPGLLSNIFSNFLPYLKHKDPSACVAALKCLNEIVSLEPTTPEQKDILLRGMKASDTLSSSWLLHFITTFLKTLDTNETVRLTCWQLMGNLCKHHFSFVEDSIPLIENLLFADLTSSSQEIQLYATYALNKLLEGIIGKEELENYNKDLWRKLLGGPLISLLQSPGAIACEACDCLANMGPIIFSNLKEEEQIFVITLIFGCVNHEKAKVRAGAVHTLGIFLLFPQMMQEQFLYDAKDLLVKSLSDSFLVVRIKAAWALGNLVDLVVNNQEVEFLQNFSMKSILHASLALTKDDDLVKSNILRAMGYVLLALKEEDMEDPEMHTLLEKSVQFLLKCTMSGTKMKMRWNACYAIGTMLKNTELLDHSEKWMGGLIQNLSTLIVSCSNFKVRASACTALRRIPARTYFSLHYPFVWSSLLDGLDNAANMPDFREYKHQDSLKQHLCLAICHITTLLQYEDLPELEGLMELRLETLMEHITYFQENTPPEQTALLISAANHIQDLIQDPRASSFLGFLHSFKLIFSVMHLS